MTTNNNRLESSQKFIKWISRKLIKNQFKDLYCTDYFENSFSKTISYLRDFHLVVHDLHFDLFAPLHFVHANRHLRVDHLKIIVFKVDIAQFRLEIEN